MSKSNQAWFAQDYDSIILILILIEAEAEGLQV